jgi:hypothetical protein
METASKKMVLVEINEPIKYNHIIIPYIRVNNTTLQQAQLAAKQFLRISPLAAVFKLSLPRVTIESTNALKNAF